MTTAPEIWQYIPGVTGYQASDLGRIRSLPRIVKQKCKWGGVMDRVFNGKILMARPNVHGYGSVYVGSPVKCVTVHKLVALTFLGPRQNGQEVNHKDGDKSNCCPSNLEYVSSTVNNHHALKTGLRKMKVSDADITKMKSLAGIWSLRKIGRKFGIHSSYVRYLIDDKRKVHADAY